MQYFGQKTLVICLTTADGKVFFVKSVNLETITDMQSWWKTWRTMDTIWSVQNKNFSGDGKGVYEHFSSRQKGWKSVIGHFLGIWQFLWRFILESSYFNTPSICDEWYCWKSGTQNQGRNFCCFVPVRLGWKMVCWFCGMFLQNATLLKRPVIPFGFIVKYHPISAKDHSSLHQFGKNVIFGIFFDMHCLWRICGKEVLW